MEERVAKVFPAKAELDQNVEKCCFEMADDFSILKADNAFCRFFNDSNPVSLRDYLDSTVAREFRTFLSKLEATRQVSYAPYLRIRGKSRLVLLYIFKTEANNYDIILYDTMYMGDMVESLIATNRRNAAIFSCVKVTYFIYDSISGQVAVSNTQGIGNSITFMLENFSIAFAGAVQEKSGMDLGGANGAEIERLYRNLAAHTADQHYVLTCADGTALDIVTRSLTSSFIQKSQIIGILGHRNVQEDISLGYESKLDGLTGVMNKKSITEYAVNRIESGHAVTTMMIIDVDDFKRLNDTYGHSFGDDVLIRFSGVLNSAVGAKGRVGRFGGDEFFVLLEEIQDIQQVREVARNIRLGIQWMYTSEMPELIVTCTIGIARAPVDGGTFAEVFAKADKMLYYAKSKGKNCYVYYNPELHAALDMEKIAGKKSGAAGAQETYFLGMQLEILEKCFSRRPGWFVDVMESVKNLLVLQRISLYRREDGQFRIQSIFCQNKADVRHDAIDESYLGMFGKGTILINDNILMYEAVRRNVFIMYYNAGIVSSFELLIKEGDEITGLLCFDRGNPARCWTQQEIYFLTMLCNYLLKYGC